MLGVDSRGALLLCGTDSIVSSSQGSDDDYNVDFVMSIEGIWKTL